MSEELLITNFRKLIISILNNQEEAEKIRIFLCNNPNFNYNVICERIDKSKMGIINTNILSSFLKSHSINFTPKLINAFITHFTLYNQTQDTFLSYDDMKNILYPKTYVSNNNQNESTDNDMTFDLEEMVVKLIVSELRLLSVMSICLTEFYKDESFNPHLLVNFLNDGNQLDYINEDSIEKFCSTYQIKISHNELRIILYYLQADHERKIHLSTLKNLFNNLINVHKEFYSSNNNIIIDNEFNSNQSGSKKKLNKNDSCSTDFSFLNNSPKIDLKTFLYSLIKYEKILYNYRKKIYTNSEIIPIELFYIFDNEDKSMITRKDFKEVLFNYFNIVATNKEIELVYHNYCHNVYNNEDYLTYEDFKRLFLPYDKLKKKEKMVDFDNEALSKKTQMELIEMFKVLLTFEEKIEQLKNQFVNVKKFASYEQFLLLKGKEKNNMKINKIDKKMLYDYLLVNQCNGDLLDDFGLNVLFNRLDRDMDGYISFEDFAFNISPIDIYSEVKYK